MSLNHIAFMDKKQYIAPQLSSVTFRNERGYTGSDVASGLTNKIEMLFLEQNGHKQEVETFSKHNDWRSGDDNSFWQ